MKKIRDEVVEGKKEMEKKGEKEELEKKMEKIEEIKKGIVKGM